MVIQPREERSRRRGTPTAGAAETVACPGGGSGTVVVGAA